MARNYCRYYCLINFVLLMLVSSISHSAAYYKTNLKQVNNSQLEAVGRRVDFTTQQNLDDTSKKATLSLSTNELLTITGNSMRSRIFYNTSKGGQFSTSGVEQITTLLTSLNYVIDHDTKEIYKVTRIDGLNCKNYGYKWKTAKGTISNCPVDAANSALNERVQSQPKFQNPELIDLYTDNSYTVLVSTLPDNANIGTIYVKGRAIYEPTGTSEILGEVIYKGEKIPPSELEKTYMSDFQLGQLMLGLTFDRNYTWTSVKEIFTAMNNYEITNNLAYIELEKALFASGNIVSDDTSITPETDEEGNPTGGFKIPPFCEYAKPICDFIAWVKEEVTGETDTEVDIQQSDIDANHNIDQKYFEYDGGCPPDYTFEITIFSYTDSVTISYVLFCNYIRGLAPYLYFISWLGGAFIVAGVRNA